MKRGSQPFYDRKIWGFKLRLSTRGNLSEQRWLTMEPFHDVPEREALREALKPGGVFVDIGANAGFFTFWAMAQRLNALQVIAVEPSATMLERLKFNLAINGLQNAVRLCECAVTPSPCEVMVEEHLSNLGQTSIVTGGAGRRVPGIPLLQIISEAGAKRIDALKIDIEGHEIPVLNSFFLSAGRALWPHMIIGEIVGENGDAFQRMLTDQGYLLNRVTKMNGVFKLPAEK